MFVSGLAWLVADAAWYVWGGYYAFIALFAGGVLIFPLSLAIAKAMRAPSPTKGNPLTLLAFETTFPLFAGLFIAYGLLQLSPDLVGLAFAAFATIIGARYFGFATLYRERVYWLLGMVLFLIGIGFALDAFLALNGGTSRLPFHVTLAVGSAELLFSAWLFTRWNASIAQASAGAGRAGIA